MTDPATANPANRRLVLGVVFLVIGGIMIAVSSIAISVTLDRQAREEAAQEKADAEAAAECRTEARNLEFDGLRVEMGATTALIEFAIKNPDRTPAELAAAIERYHADLDRAREAYTDAADNFAVC